MILFLILIIQVEEDFDYIFVYRNTKDLYIVFDYKVVNYITVYIIYSYNKNDKNIL